MARTATQSPFQCGGVVYQFPNDHISASLQIRIESTSGKKVHISIRGTPTTTKADIYLESGEAFEVKGISGLKGSDVKIIDVTGDPIIYFAMV
jgi:hypothetical protein